jgi:5-dehydro-2-deoxygluconokinase
MCSSEYATWEELQSFLERGVTNPRLREDRQLSHLHRTTYERNQKKSELLKSCKLD